MAYGAFGRRSIRRWGVPAALCGTLLAGGAACDGGGDPGGKGSPKAGRAGGDARAGDGGAPSATPTPEADPERIPRTAAQARQLIEDVIADADLFGPDAVRATPYESDPARWTVLGGNCAWRAEELPDDVLATLTRYFEVPAKGGKGSVELSATVTVHRTTLDAAWEQARMLEEAVGCPEQTLRPGERLTGLMSMALARGEGGNGSSDDTLSESGECVSDSRGGPYPYSWDQSTFGPVVVAVSACGGPERSAQEVRELSIQPISTMLTRAEETVGREDGAGGEDGGGDADDADGTGSPAPDPGASGAKEGA